MKIHFLGTGTSDGVPTLLCNCKICKSKNPKDKRLRSSILLKSDNNNILIDTSPDLRVQLFNSKINNLNAILYTHTHYDHISGLDEIRSFTIRNKTIIPIYAEKKNLKYLKKKYFYFFKPLQKGGGVPKVTLNQIKYFKQFNVDKINIIPIPVMHGILKITSFLINKKILYMTDVSNIPQKSLNFIKKYKVDILILDLLRKRKHSTHFNFDEAIENAKIINAKKTYFTHITHEISHNDDSKLLPKNMFFAYDNLIIQI